MEEVEIWERVKVVHGIDYSELYETSTFGNVRSVDREIKCKNGYIKKYKGVALSPCKNKTTGYMQVSLSYNGKCHTIPVHELVMNAHCSNPNPEIYTDINHIDENKTNNRIDNLEWTTHKENVNHGTAIERRVVSKRNNFIPIVQLDFDGNIINVYYNTEEFDNTSFLMNNVITTINSNGYIYRQYFWIRLDEYNNLTFNELVNLINCKLFKKKDNKQNKKVIQFSKDDKFIKEYDSITDAAKEVGCSRQAIQQCMSGKIKTCCGYRWKYLNK